MTEKTILVTGGARRIGAVICHHLHAQGHALIIHHHHSVSAANQLADQLNSERTDSAFLLNADLTDLDANAFIQQAVSCTGNLDVLVNNASVFFPTRLDALTEKDWQQLVNTNVLAPLRLSQAAAAYLKTRRGTIVNITDIYASRPLKDHSVYNLTQAALESMTRNLARELAPEVRVNAVAPGAILWPENSDTETQQKLLQSIPLQRTGTPIDIARAVQFLIEAADYLTGQTITVDGGRQLTTVS